MARAAAEPSVKLWRADDLGAAELLRGRFPDHSYAPHTHDTVCLAVITGGAIRIRAHGGEQVAAKGDVVAIDAETVHAGWPAAPGGWKMRTLHARPAALAGALDQDRDGPAALGLAEPVIRDRTLAAWLFGVHACSEHDGPALLREQQYLRALGRLFRRHTSTPLVPPAPREADAVRRARALIDGQLERSLSLGEIAAEAGLPRFRLFRAFVNAVGLPPHAYQRQARVRRAAALIRRGQSLSEAACAAGFADQAHLTRTFRRVMGVTPGVYRAAFR